jgi:tetratricopeptide (TPR) repeat protein
MMVVCVQVAGERNADVLVILGAQHSAQKRYREALYCLDRALQLDPGHVRGHYSRGQVGATTNAHAGFQHRETLLVNMILVINIIMTAVQPRPAFNAAKSACGCSWSSKVCPHT